MELYGIITTITTLIASGGWFIFYRANKRKANGDATQAEAEGWKAMQSLYQKTIADFNNYSEDMRRERGILKQENTELREKYKRLDEEIIQLKRRLSRQGRKIDALSPFLCGVVGCVKRQRVNINAIPTGDDSNAENENENE